MPFYFYISFCFRYPQKYSILRFPPRDASYADIAVAAIVRTPNLSKGW